MNMPVTTIVGMQPHRAPHYRYRSLLYLEYFWSVLHGISAVGWLFQFPVPSARAIGHTIANNGRRVTVKVAGSSRQSHPCRPRPQNNLRPIDKGPRSSTSRNILQLPSPPLPPTSTLFLKPSRTCTHASTHADPSFPSAPPRFSFSFSLMGCS
jgi:hypothetical protein